jgi:hypothetical protein
MDYYDEPTAQEAIELAARIVEFVERQIAGSRLSSYRRAVPQNAPTLEILN